MTPKEFLQQAYFIDRQIKLDMEKLKAARAALFGKGANHISDGTAPERRGSGVENAYIRVLAYEEKINAEIDELSRKREEIEKVIGMLPDKTERELLSRRYLFYGKWDEIAEDMNYSTRRIFQIHGNALKNISVNCSKFHLISH